MDAGFEVVGVDIAPQPHYPFAFIEADAAEYLEHLIDTGDLCEFDAVHASPPCQRHSRMTNCRPGLAVKYADLIGPLRDLLVQTGGMPYVIENVEGAPLRNPETLCGFMFGRELYRHRLFEANFPITVPEHPEHSIPASKAGHWTPGTVMSVAGHVAPIWKAREVMECDWTTREELVEGVPPYYISECIAPALLSHLSKESA